MDVLNKLICYCLICQIICIDILRASSSNLNKDELSDTSPLVSRSSVEAPSSDLYGSANDVTIEINGPIASNSNIASPDRISFNQQLDGENNPFIFVPARLQID